MPSDSTRPVVLFAAPDGLPIPELMQRVQAFEFEDNDDKMDQFKVTLRNEDLLLHEHPAFQYGSIIQATWGYPHALARPRKFVLGPGAGAGKRGVKASGFTTVQIEGRAGVIGLDRVARSRTWNGMKRSDVVREVAKEYGFTDDVIFTDDSEVVHDTITQPGESDARFLRRLAKKEGFIFYLDETGLHWHDRKFDTEPIRSYQLRGSRVLGVSWDQNLWKQPARVRNKSRNADTKAEFDESALDGQDNADAALAEWGVVRDPSAPQGLRWAWRKPDGSPPDWQDWLSAGTEFAKAVPPANLWPGIQYAADAVDNWLGVSEIVTTVGDKIEEGRRRAAARHRKLSRKRINVKLTVVGDTKLRAKSIINLVGFGDILSGKYYAKQVLHKVDRGYVCELDLMRGNIKKPKGKLAQRTNAPVNQRTDPAVPEVPRYDSAWDDPEVKALYDVNAAPLVTAGYDEKGDPIVEWR